MSNFETHGEEIEKQEKPETELEEFVFVKLDELNFSKGLSDEARSMIGKMKKHNEHTYCHILRVARVSYIMSQELKISDGKLEFIGGLLHDIGKLGIDKNLLSQDKNIHEGHYRSVQKHSLKGWENLKNDYALTALIVGGHHNYGEKGYGVEKMNWPNFVKESPDLCKIVDKATLTVAIADFADAARTRKTQERSGGKELSLQDRLLIKFPGQEEKIDFVLNNKEVASLYEPKQ